MKGEPEVLFKKELKATVKPEEEVKNEVDMQRQFRCPSKIEMKVEGEAKPHIKEKHDSVNPKFEMKEIKIDDSKLEHFKSRCVLKHNMKMESGDGATSQGVAPISCNDGSISDVSEQSTTSHENVRETVINVSGSTSPFLINSDDEEERPESHSSRDANQSASNVERTAGVHIRERSDDTQSEIETPRGLELLANRASGNERSFECFQCKKGFPDGTTCNNHIRAGCLRRYPCEKCGKEFNYRCNLLRHLIIHTGQKPYSCNHPKCGKSFAQSTTLLNHKRTHSGEKPFRCHYLGCEFSFARKTTLDHHVHTHSGERPYRCDYSNCVCSSRLSFPT